MRMHWRIARLQGSLCDVVNSVWAFFNFIRNAAERREGGTWIMFQCSSERMAKFSLFSLETAKRKYTKHCIRIN